MKSEPFWIPSEAPGPLGRIEVRGDPDLWSYLRPRLDGACRSSQSGLERVSWGSIPLLVKFGPLGPWPRLRHGLRALWPGLDIPRLQEFENLHWLRLNGFGAAEPLVAGCYRSLSLPVFQFLATREVVGTPNLRQVLEDPADARRKPALGALALDLARLHGRGFTHRDVYPRNVLVQENSARSSSSVRVLFLDAWRGGPLPGLRGRNYDLACFLLHAPSLCSPEELEFFLAAYFRETSQLGHALDRHKTLLRVFRHRSRLVKRFRARRRPGSAIPLPVEDWIPR